MTWKLGGSDGVFESDTLWLRLPVLRLSSAAPSNKATCLGYGHYRVLVTAGLFSEQTGEDGRAGYGGRER